MVDKEILKMVEKFAEGCKYIEGKWDKSTDSCKKDNTIIRISKGVDGADVEIRSDRATIFIQGLKTSDVISKENKGGVKSLKLTFLGEDFDNIIRITDYGSVDIDIGKELE
ncbi:MAG: hypothetical protein B6U78_03045 [Candidatus Aenigmarchaeota archaeon ex4484_224]|nr:MAG: hypothetical protein B6U78_03045 [Candidatus Aenigmarchaeota archaeon ex4484_224]